MKKLTYTMFWCLAVFFSFTFSTMASTISFRTDSVTVGTASPFSVDVFIDSTVSVNAINIVIPLPKSVDLVGISDANSVINLWVDRPKLDDKHNLVLSGLIPGGYKGMDGRLLTIKLRSASTGTINLIASTDSVAYTNTENTKPDVISSKSLSIKFVSGKQNTSTDIEDTTPPENFIPVYVQLPDGESTKWAVGFFAQDKGSGVKEYLVAESKKKIDITDTEKLQSLSWVVSDSPSSLIDQKRYSYVYIKAVDNKGNIRIATLAPAIQWYKQPIGYILMTVLTLGVLYAIYRKIISKNKF